MNPELSLQPKFNRLGRNNFFAEWPDGSDMYLLESRGKLYAAKYVVAGRFQILGSGTLRECKAIVLAHYAKLVQEAVRDFNQSERGRIAALDVLDTLQREREAQNG